VSPRSWGRMIWLPWPSADTKSVRLSLLRSERLSPAARPLMPEPLDVGTLSPEEFREVRRVFEAALERPASARGAFVEQACAGNAVLRAEVDRMLAAERQPHRLIDGAAGREAMV